MATPVSCRVRCVARKRWPLAEDLARLYAKKSGHRTPDKTSTITVIGHTRFATSSKNIESELHPHEFDTWKMEQVWEFNITTMRFEKHDRQTGLHLTHNGDFDALVAYDQVVVVDDVGLWLERILHVKNDTRGDSPKVCGMMDLLRVQGRWAASARLAYVRCVLKDPKDVSAGQTLSKSAPNSFPDASYWHKWETYLDGIFSQHVNNIVKVKLDDSDRTEGKYTLDRPGVASFISCLINGSAAPELKHSLHTDDWSSELRVAFISEAVRGFLRADLYSALTELLSRADGSFGLQVHSTLERGVVVLASKGQPMSVSFADDKPMVLFGSEAEAVAVPVNMAGAHLSYRLDLDSKGEIIRVGSARLLDEGTCANGARSVAGDVSVELKETLGTSLLTKKPGGRKATRSADTIDMGRRLLLKCGIELRSYSLISCSEARKQDIWDRCVSIKSRAVPYDPRVDLVLKDIQETPGVLRLIDETWVDDLTHEFSSGKALCDHLLSCMSYRLKHRLDIYDLLISGVEASLWMAEQWAADVRRIFPLINIVTVSPNKLLGLGQHSAGKVFFPSSEAISEKRIDSEHTCVLFISQSGQTFATLHATRTLAPMVRGRLWILTGAQDSKMEQVRMCIPLYIYVSTITYVSTDVSNYLSVCLSISLSMYMMYIICVFPCL